MSEKLTVAELLARNGRESSSADTGRRRRRHRNLEQGGVSVAELTGSIPVVQTEDDVAKAAKPEDAAAKVTEKPAAPKQEPATTQEIQQDQRSVSRTSERPEEKTGQLSNVESSPKKAAEAPKERKATEPTFGDVARGRVAEKPAEPTQPTQSTQPAEPAKTTKATKVTKPIKPSKSAAAGTAAGTAAVGTAATEAASGTDAKTPEKGGVTKREKDSAKKKAVTAAAAPGVSSDERAQFAELERTLEDGEVVEYEDDTISWPMMILQAILAIAVGVGVFFGFSLVWAKAPTILALVLAIAVTLLLVGLVHALLRHRDKLLMILAAVVGLVLTIGPRLVQGL
ncbi:hypothetical protein [uncultured Corynebacterium sp.]|uniref:DUF2157 domain-containing protein n=1 Tax=uncultured Corynebacterium sp. TaxID=159447 RepID=UPI002600750A|nr:hypothetical protein [uncultured Corynebacterium sp.]